MPISGAAAGGIVFRVVNSSIFKAGVVAVLTVNAWHYTDAGKIDNNRAAIEEHSKRLDFQREQLIGKVDEARYEKDQQSIREDLREIRNNQQIQIGLLVQMEKR